jgi:fructose-1,6-bisphosphatase
MKIFKKSEIRNNISQFFYSINMSFEKDYIEKNTKVIQKVQSFLKNKKKNLILRLSIS